MKRLLASAATTIAVAGLGAVVSAGPADAAPAHPAAPVHAAATANLPGYAVPGSRIRTGPRLNDRILGEVQAGGSITIHCWTEGDSLGPTSTNEWFDATDNRSGITGYTYGQGAGGTTGQIIPRC